MALRGTEQMTATLDALRLALARLERNGTRNRVEGASDRSVGVALPPTKLSGTGPPATGSYGRPRARVPSAGVQAATGVSGAEPDGNRPPPAPRTTIVAPRQGTVLRFGIAAIDTHLPAGGLSCAALHELAGIGPDTEHGTTPALLVAGLLARQSGQVLWVSRHRDLFAPALAAVGLHPDRIVFAEAGRSVLAVMEEGLRHSGLAGVVGELSGPLGLTASRRLQLGAEAGVPAFVLRRSRRFDDPLLSAPSAAATRWRVASLHTRAVRADAPGLHGVGRALWRLDLVRCRGGVPSSWTVEACDAQNRLGLAAEPCHRPSAAPDGAGGRPEGLRDEGMGDAGWDRGGRRGDAAGGVAA